MLQLVHEVEKLPGGAGIGSLLLGPVALSELLDLVAALDGGLVGVVVAAAGGDGDGDLLPLGGPERAPLEGVPTLLVGLDQVDCFLVRPEGWLWLFVGRRRGGRGGLKEKWVLGAARV